MIDGVEWRIIDTLSGSSILFVPASGTGVAEVGWQTIEHLAKKYRVISLDYPPLGDLNAMFCGVIELFDQLGISQVDALGGSGGTLFMQPFMLTYPERFGKIILTTPVPPDPARGEQISNSLKWLRWMPTPILRWLTMKSFERLLSAESNQPDMALTTALLKEVVQYRLQRKNFLAMLAMVSDMTDSFSYSAHDLQKWAGELLLIFGKDDPATPEPVRAKMLALYPTAQVKVFEGGHGIAVTHQAEYFAAIDQFLDH